jgi:hypothetical protein
MEKGMHHMTMPNGTNAPSAIAWKPYEATRVDRTVTMSHREGWIRFEWVETEETVWLSYISHSGSNHTEIHVETPAQDELASHHKYSICRHRLWVTRDEGRAIWKELQSNGWERTRMRRLG